MLPIVDKPLIQYAVEEAVAAGATRLVFITGASKRSIEDYFDSDAELESALRDAGKHDALRLIESIIPRTTACIFIRQGQPLGLGHAVLCAKPVVGDEPFYVHLPDDLIDAEESVLSQMRREYEAHESSVLGVETVPIEDTKSYGIVATRLDAAGRQVVGSIVEKPAPEKAPSNLAVVGRYLLTPRIFHHLERIGRGAGGEIQLTDAISALLTEEAVMAYPFQGKRYDCGNKLGYLKATVEYALKHRELADDFAAYLRAADR